MRILLPLDGTPFAEEALPMAAMLGRELHAEVAILTIAPVEAGAGAPAPHPETAIHRLHDIQGYQNAVSAALGDLPQRHAVAFDRRPAAGIIQYARSHHVDLIVMATHAWFDADSAHPGSVAAEVLKSGVAPVVMVHPSEAQTSRGASRQPSSGAGEPELPAK